MDILLFTYIKFRVHRIYEKLDLHLKSIKQPWVSSFYDYKRIVEKFSFIDICFYNKDTFIKEYQHITFAELKDIVPENIYECIKYHSGTKDNEFITIPIDSKFNSFSLNSTCSMYLFEEGIILFSRNCHTFLDAIFNKNDLLGLNMRTFITAYKNSIDLIRILLFLVKNANYELTKKLDDYLRDYDYFYIRRDLINKYWEKVRDKIYRLLYDYIDERIIVCARYFNDVLYTFNINKPIEYKLY